MFEGLAAGLEEDESGVWTMFTGQYYDDVQIHWDYSNQFQKPCVAAIACHKFVITFCVCLEFRQTGIKQSLFFTYLTTFSLISSLGIAIGIAITEAHSQTVDPVLSATLEGIAAGSLIYVVMFEVRAVNKPSRSFTSSLKAPTSTFKIENLLRHD